MDMFILGLLVVLHCVSSYWNWVLENPVVAQLGKKLIQCLEPIHSWPCFTRSSYCFSSEPDEASLHLHILYALKSVLYILLLSPLLATCPSHLMMLVETTVYRDVYKWFNDKNVMILDFHSGLLMLILIFGCWRNVG